MLKRGSNRISILIVPEDDAEPYSFRLKTSTVRIIYVVGALLVFHIIGGAVFYWKYARLNNFNERLISQNTQLKEDNRRVIRLSEQFLALEREYTKVKSLLGVESEEEDTETAYQPVSESSLSFENIVAIARTENEPAVNIFQSQGQFLLQPRNSKLHDYAENMPTFLPVKGFLTQDFKSDGWFGPQSHNGIDIVAKKGSIVHAAGAGVIIFANWTSDLGNLIIIDHGGGILTYYAHNQRLLQHEKSFVKKGDAIALLGNTGKSSGPHLHFEIWKDGVPVDPKQYVLAFSEGIATN